MTPMLTSIRAPRWELHSLSALIGLYIFGHAYGPESLDILNVVGPVALAVILGFSALRIVLRNASSIWSALVWFRISTAVYYGAGSLVAVLADEAMRDYMLAFFFFNSSNEAKLNLVVAIGCLTALLGANLCLPTSPNGEKPYPPSEVPDRGWGLFLVGMVLLLVGGIVKYVFVLPNVFGLTDFVLPNAVATIGKFSSAAVYLLTVWSREYRRSALPFVVAFVLLEVMIGILALTKADVLMVLILFFFAFLRPKITRLRLFAVVAALVASYVIIIPVVDYGRLEVQLRHGELGGADFAERLDIIARAPVAIGELAQGDTAARALTRITYVNQSTFAIQEYDSGRPGHTLSNALAVFIPRALWPDKPIITQIAVDFNVAATGNPNSASSPGLFAEGYWNGGWLGVVLIMFPLGILLALLSRFTIDVLQNGKWLYFPVVLLAMQVGLRTDGYVVPDILGGTVIVVAAYVLLGLVEPFLRFRVGGQGVQA